jgi:hypothetical protein
MPTEKDDKEIEYGKWQEHTPEETAAELNTMPPVVGDIWPNWNEGVPTKLRRQLGSPFFTLGEVRPIRTTCRSWATPQMATFFLSCSFQYLFSCPKTHGTVLNG